MAALSLSTRFADSAMKSFSFSPLTQLIFGEGTFERIGEVASHLGFRHTLIVADSGIVSCGFVDRARTSLSDSGIEVFLFHEFDSNPDSIMIEAGRRFAEPLSIDSIIGLGGGSSMDTAKGINFVLTGGGSIKDYWGYGKAADRMLPMIGVPTTSGTGSEAQSYALISDSETHTKMACGDPGAAFKVAILDPLLTVSQPTSVTATAGFDAISHAVETFVTTKRTPVSDLFSLEAWRLLSANYERVLSKPDDIEARAAMQLGAHWAGVAIENSMLGAAHACANPLTAIFNTEHGVAISLMLPHVVRWNAPFVSERYRQLLDVGSLPAADPGEALARRLEQFIQAGGLPRGSDAANVSERDLSRLAQEASTQWTGKFNPREFGAEGALELYRTAFGLKL